MSSTPSQVGPVAVCVLGMHRSGTSALARLINLLGVDLGTDLIPGSIDNPRGFWEHRGILNAHEDILDALGSSFDDFFPLPPDWNLRPEVQSSREKLLEIVKTQFGEQKLWGFKDPRTCRLLPIWHEIFAASGVEGRYVIVIRSPEEIARSLQARDGYALNKSLLLTLTHLLEAEVGTRGRPRVVVSFDQLLNNWRGTAEKIQRVLGLNWPRSPEEIAPEVAEFLDPNLRHHAVSASVQSSPAASPADASAVRWMAELHQMFLAAQDDPSRIDSGLVDRLRQEMKADRPRLACWRAHRSLERRFMVLEQWGIHLDQKFRDAREENNWLKLAMAQLSLDPAGVANAMKARCDAWESEQTPQQPLEANPLDLQVLSDQSQAAAAIARLQAEIHGQAQVIDQLKFQTERVRWFDVHVPRLDAQIVDLMDDRAGMQAEIDRLKSWNAELDAGRTWLLTEQANLQGEIKNLKAWTAELQLGRDWLTEENVRLQSENQRQQQWIAELEASRQWLEDELKMASVSGGEVGNDVEIQMLRSRLAERDQTIKRLEEWTSELDQSRRWLSEQFAGAQKEVGNYKATLDELRPWVTELEKAKQWLHEQRESLLAELKRRDEAAARLAAETSPSSSIAS